MKLPKAPIFADVVDVLQHWLAANNLPCMGNGVELIVTLPNGRDRDKARHAMRLEASTNMSYLVGASVDVLAYHDIACSFAAPIHNKRP